MNLGELLITLKVDTSNMEVLEAEIKKVEKTAEKGFGKVEDAAEGAEEGLTGMVGAAAELAPVFAVAAAAAGIMVDWFMKTEEGANIANTAITLLGEGLNSMMLHRDANYGEALEIAKEENRLRGQARFDMVEQAKLAAEVRVHRMQTYDIDASIEDKIKAQRSALEDQKNLEDKITSGLFEQLAVVERRLALNPSNTKALNEQAELQAKIWNTAATGSLLMQRSLQSLEKQQKRMDEAKMKALEEAFTPETENIMRKYEYALQDLNTWTQIFGETTDTTEDKLNLYTNTLKDLISAGLTPADAEVQKMVRSIRQLNDELNAENLKAWTDATMIVEQYRPGNEAIGGDLSLDKYGSLISPEGRSPYISPKDRENAGKAFQETADSMNGIISIANELDRTFSTLFTNIGGGFAGMVDAMLDSLKLLLVELVSKAAIFGILTLISGGTGGLAAGALKMIKGGFLKFAGFAADGINSSPGGMTVVGERGPELVNLPRGAQVIPNHLLGAATAGGGQVVFEIEGTKLVGVLQNQNRKSNSFR